MAVGGPGNLLDPRLRRRAAWRARKKDRVGRPTAVPGDRAPLSRLSAMEVTVCQAGTVDQSDLKAA